MALSRAGTVSPDRWASPGPTAPWAADLDVVLTEVDGRRYGVFLEDVVEVVAMVEVTPLPGAPEVVEGVVNRRGDVVPVVDGRRILGATPRPPSPSERLVFVTAGRRTIALRVDAATGLAAVDRASLRPRDDVLPEASRVAGVAPTDDGLLVIYDLEGFLGAADVSLLDAALDRAGGPGPGGPGP